LKLTRALLPRSKLALGLRGASRLWRDGVDGLCTSVAVRTSDATVADHLGRHPVGKTALRRRPCSDTNSQGDTDLLILALSVEAVKRTLCNLEVELRAVRGEIGAALFQDPNGVPRRGSRPS
jgi:hypothetical protein